MLEGVRVLDLTDARGAFAGYLLASLGADVVAVEPPTGSDTRRAGPFDRAGRSLLWEAFGRGKRSVVVDLETSVGVTAFEQLVIGADVLVESAGPGAFDALGFGYRALARVNERLVHVSISAFGESGPKAAWAATDLTIAAASGFMSLTGDEDRPPLRISSDQVFLHAGLEAVAAALAALYERNHASGRGQHIDVSALESFTFVSQYQMLGAPLNGISAKRIGGGAATGPVRLRFVWPCRDGHVAVAFAFGSALGRFARNLMECVYEAGFCDDKTLETDWLGYGEKLLAGAAPLEEWEQVKQAVEAFLRTKTKAELVTLARARRLVLCPIATLGETLTNEHFNARKVFSDVDGVAVPASFAKFDGARLPVPAPAPALGSSSGVAWSGPQTSEFPRRAEGELGGASGTALAALKVLDLSWVMAGAAGGRVLADYGATVVRVESVAHVDTIRTLGPFRDNQFDPEFSGPYNCANAGKLGLALNLSNPASRKVLADLVRWADVVLDSYSPGVMAKLGFGIDVLRALNPSVVALSSSLLGQDGPLADMAGYGNMGAAMSGFTSMTGWPDRDPAGPFSAYSDTTAPRFMAIAVLAALERRRRTGEGAFVDLSQAESALQLLVPELLDFQREGRESHRIGNDHPSLLPHGVYPAASGGWLAVACRDDDDWAALVAILGRPDLKALSLDERRERQSDIAGIVTTWVSNRPAHQAAEDLQAVGVPAHAVQAVEDVFNDPQLRHRRYFREVAHPTQPRGTTWIESHRPRLSRTPARFERGGPTYGQDVDYVLQHLLRYSDDDIAELAVAGALE